MQGAIKGTATYRERIALPPDAVLEATLEDVSKADAPAEVIGRARVENPGNPPIRFEIPYDTSRIDPPPELYGAGADSGGGETVLPHRPAPPGPQSGQGQRGGATDAPRAGRRRTTVSLENTYWKLTHLGGTPVAADSQQTGAAPDPQHRHPPCRRLGWLQPVQRRLRADRRPVEARQAGLDHDGLHGGHGDRAGVHERPRAGRWVEAHGQATAIDRRRGQGAGDFRWAAHGVTAP